jgi:glycosyltransferase involved in cell wall biosynthesis
VNLRRTSPGEGLRGTAPRIVYGVTAPLSATLLRGQLGWFRRRGWDVHLVISPGDLSTEIAEAEGVTLHPLPMERATSPVSDLLSFIRWVALLRRLDPDVLKIATPKAGLLGSLAGWLTGVPVRVYEMWGLRLEGARTPAQRVVLWLAERLSVLLATDVVCVSHSLRAAAAARGLFGRRDRPVVLGHGSSNGVSPERWDAGFAAVDRGAVRAGWGVDPDDLVVGFVGRLCYDKGVPDLLDAFRALSDLPVALVLVGPVEDEELRARIAELGDQVIHLDMTLDLSPVYVGIDVLCLPTRREGFPNVVLEAALAEVPSVTTTATGARDSVVPGITGWLVETGNVPELAERLRACAADRGAIRSAGRAARARALRDFRPEEIWAGLESVYRGRAVQSSGRAGVPAEPVGRTG